MAMIRPRSDVVYGICRGLPSADEVRIGRGLLSASDEERIGRGLLSVRSIFSKAFDKHPRHERFAMSCQLSYCKFCSNTNPVNSKFTM